MDDRSRELSRLTRRLFVASVGILAAAGGLGHLVVWLGRPPLPVQGVAFPPAFFVSTLLLAAGSAALQRAIASVRIERQRPFRRSLLLALAAGTAFVGVQGAGLWWLLQTQSLDPADAATGAGAFVFVFAFLHGLHFTVALLCLVFVTLRAFADRYDHEYYWGVLVCACFWHALGVVWLAILAVLVIAVGAAG